MARLLSPGEEYAIDYGLSEATEFSGNDLTVVMLEAAEEFIESHGYVLDDAQGWRKP